MPSPPYRFVYEHIVSFELGGKTGTLSATKYAYRIYIHICRRIRVHRIAVGGCESLILFSEFGSRESRNVFIAASTNHGGIRRP